MSKEQKILDNHKALHIGGVSVSLPSVDDAGIIAVAISEINNEMTAQEQAFFIAGFSECIKYLEMQSNER
jgi:poly(3-hydroxybutyrate) depolymerase|tara:strand:- start:523 stop:732 length:210 start_codon:yes stop_codon:yes gene_type:complete